MSVSDAGANDTTWSLAYRMGASDTIPKRKTGVSGAEEILGKNLWLEKP